MIAGSVRVSVCHLDPTLRSLTQADPHLVTDFVNFARPHKSMLLDGYPGDCPTQCEPGPMVSRQEGLCIGREHRGRATQAPQVRQGEDQPERQLRL